MRWHVQVAGAVVSGAAVCWPTPAFATQQAPAVRQDAVRPTGAGVWFWDRLRDRFTVPLGPTWLDPWPHGPCLSSPTTRV